MVNREPECLRKGKAFHKKIQSEWENAADGTITSERRVIRRDGRSGRVDIFVNTDDPDGVIAIVEIKATDWDKMTEKAVRRNVKRQIRQIWHYIESQIYKGEYITSGEKKSVSPGIIFPKSPKDKNRMKLIEDMFIEEGIQVVWHDD